MEIQKNKYQIEVINDDELSILKIFLTPGELVWSLDKDIDYKNPIEIFRKDDKCLFDNLTWFMNQEYVKSTNAQSQYDKDKNCFIWISEHPDNIDVNNQAKNHTARLIIKRFDDSFLIYPFTPIKENKGNSVITFSYNTTRCKALNLVTEKPIQDDMLLIYKKTCNNLSIENKNKNQKK